MTANQQDAIIGIQTINNGRLTMVYGLLFIIFQR
jgi:hypothetical protein